MFRATAVAANACMRVIIFTIIDKYKNVKIDYYP